MLSAAAIHFVFLFKLVNTAQVLVEFSSLRYGWKLWVSKTALQIILMLLVLLFIFKATALIQFISVTIVFLRKVHHVQDFFCKNVFYFTRSKNRTLLHTWAKIVVFSFFYSTFLLVKRLQYVSLVPTIKLNQEWHVLPPCKCMEWSCLHLSKLLQSVYNQCEWI